MTNETKDYIIDEAYKLFLNCNYDSVSINDISKAIGLTKGALYHHFKNKEELFKAVIEKYLALPAMEIDYRDISLLSYNELLLDYVKGIINQICHNDKDLVPINYLSLLADSFRHFPDFADKTLGFFKGEIDKTKKVFDLAIEKGEIRSDINTQTFAVIYHSNASMLAGNILRNNSVEEAIQMFRTQLSEIYKILKN